MFLYYLGTEPFKAARVKVCFNKINFQLTDRHTFTLMTIFHTHPKGYLSQLKLVLDLATPDRCKTKLT